MREHEHEPVVGLPERPPSGEVLLWQGSPAFAALARETFHLRGLALYFAALAAWRAAALAEEGASPGAMAAGAVWLLLLGVVPIGIIALFAALSARTTLYTITNRRLILRVGVALPITVNIPFSAIGSAVLRRYAGVGDILVALDPPHRASYVALWPHVRAFRLARPQPVLRALPDADVAAAALKRALATSTAIPVAAPRTVQPAPAPASGEPGTAVAAAAV